jgi:tripeptide aminopeptidase
MAIATLPDVTTFFIELAATLSPPGAERPVADRVLEYIEGLGITPEEDDAGSKIGSSAGNIHASLEPTAEGTPLFFCAHLDTVPPTAAITPEQTDGVIRNTGGTILGADNKSAVAVMLEAARRIVSDRLPHAGIELLFTPKEEVGLQGAYAFDHERLHARIGFVYDHAAPIGEIILGAPYMAKLDVRFRGRAAHAGMYPEEGRSAIAAAARAIADLRLGRLDEETSANVGRIEGGSARNVVPEECSFLAEARSHAGSKLAELVQEMLDSISYAASVAECEVETKVDDDAKGYRFRPDDEPVVLAQAALASAGYEPHFVLSGGGADANVFNERGLACLNLANGMAEIHTPGEHIAVADLEGMVEVTLALVDAARASG